MALKRLIIIRPGETDWNLHGRWQGWVEIPLNEHGRVQVQRLANFMRNLGLDALYSSDNRRARESAQILGEALELDPIFDERLRERSIGIWQGLIVPEIHGWYAEEYAQLEADPDGYVIPGGESLGQVRERVTAALNEIIKAADADDDVQAVGVISHSTTIRLIMKSLLPDVDLSREVFGNTAVTSLIREDDGTWKVTAINDQMHLEGLESRYMPELRNRGERE